MKRICTALLLTCALCACGLLSTAGKVVRTIDVIARDLCEVWGSENRGRLGMTPAEFCAVRENVEPFLRAARAAKLEAGQTVKANLRAR